MCTIRSEPTPEAHEEQHCRDQKHQQVGPREVASNRKPDKNEKVSHERAEGEHEAHPQRPVETFNVHDRSCFYFPANPRFDLPYATNTQRRPTISAGTAAVRPGPIIVVITAPIMRIVSPTAASTVRCCWRRNSPGKTSPSAPSTSQSPMNLRNQIGNIIAFGGDMPCNVSLDRTSFVPPANKNSNAKSI